ncbi:MAG: GAF domain-containing protein, partial [Burkholderiaceae bacterium]
FRDLTGYDRVMVYKFDPDGHGQIIAEARDPRIDSLLGHHYPATDIPQRARELYIRNRVRVLVDVHYQSSALLPRSKTGEELDMSLCYLRSMSPLHIQYLKNMGVTATLVASLVREGRLWGLVACHHYAPRNLRYVVRAACEMFAEVISTRIAAIENYAHAQVAMLVRRLEQRLIEATASEGDWRLALFRNPRALLQPLDASGAALFYDGEVLTTGDVPSTPELRSLLRWVDERSDEPLFCTSSIGQDDDRLRSLTPTASGVLAVRLSATRSEYLMWFRREQLNTMTWAGDPSKPMVGNDPLELSPRRSFAAWSEIVRGTAVPWTNAEISLARAIGVALVDIIAQIHGVRLLISEQQMSQVRATVDSSNEPVVVADLEGRVLATSKAFRCLSGDAAQPVDSLDEFALRFADPDAVSDVLDRIRADCQPWRGELALLRNDGARVPVSVRAEAVPGREGRVLGFIIVLFDLSDKRRTAEARRHLEQALQRAERDFVSRELGALAASSPDEVIAGILANANLAAMDLADAEGGVAAAPLLEEVEASTIRAASLYDQIRLFGKD